MSPAEIACLGVLLGIIDALIVEVISLFSREQWHSTRRELYSKSESCTRNRGQYANESWRVSPHGNGRSLRSAVWGTDKVERGGRHWARTLLLLVLRLINEGSDRPHTPLSRGWWGRSILVLTQLATPRRHLCCMPGTQFQPLLSLLGRKIRACVLVEKLYASMFFI